MKRHNRDDYYVVGEGILTFDRDGHATARRPSAAADMRKFRFSRLGPAGEPIDDARREIFETVSAAMTTDPAGGDPESGHRPPDSGIPAGFTYLGQFVDHDLTKDVTADQLGQDVTVDELLQGRSPALDLDSLYGRGPEKDPQFYAADGLHIKTGRTSALPPGAPGGDNPFAQAEREGFDLPRANAGSTPAERRLAGSTTGSSTSSPAPPRARCCSRPPGTPWSGTTSGCWPRTSCRASSSRKSSPMSSPTGASSSRCPPPTTTPAGTRRTAATASSRATGRRCRSSSRSRRTGSATAWCETSTTGTRSSTTNSR